jgi:molecular chaperone HscB
MDFFSFYNIPVAFILDEQALRQKYLQLSKQYHPDFYGLESEEKQAEVLELSTLNNEAFKTLSDFEKRFAYILNLNGLLDEEKNKRALPQLFLMEMMDTNEALMELEFDYNNAALQKLHHNLTKLKEDLMNEINPELNSYTNATASDESLNKLLIYYLKTRYLKRLEDNLAAIEAKQL